MLCSPCRRTSSDKPLSGALQSDGTVTPQGGRRHGQTALSVGFTTCHRGFLRVSGCRASTLSACRCSASDASTAPCAPLHDPVQQRDRQVAAPQGKANLGRAKHSQRVKNPAATPTYSTADAVARPLHHTAQQAATAQRIWAMHGLWYRVSNPSAAPRSLRGGRSVQALHHAAPQAAREVGHVLDAGAGRAARRVGRQVQGSGRVCSPAAARAVAGRCAGGRRARLRAGWRGACGGAGPLRGPPAGARVQAARRGAAADRGRPGPQLAQRRARQRARRRRQPLRQPACAHTAGVRCPLATAAAWTIWPSYAGAGPPQLAHRRASACSAPAAGRRACQS